MQSLFIVIINNVNVIHIFIIQYIKQVYKMKLMIKSDAIVKIKIDFSSERINKKKWF